MEDVKVAILGASGETGGSIVNALLDSSENFRITALTRPSSMQKPANARLQERGVKVVAFDASWPVEELAAIIKGIDVVIAAVGSMGFKDQIPLATASKMAGVKRFVPCAYAPVTPPKDVVDARDEKEAIYSHIKKLHLPYTIIDVGWWYQGLIPKLPSGRSDYARTPLPVGENKIPGDGEAPNALTDARDVGRYVAKIIVDPRTINKMVFTYNEVLTTNQVYDIVEKVSGECVERSYVSGAELAASIVEADKIIKTGDVGYLPVLKKYFYQFYYSWGIRGDNTPEVAEYLGYLNGKDLYPDFEFIKFEEFFKEILEGKARRVYS